jgi:hypothetical protein
LGEFSLVGWLFTMGLLSKIKGLAQIFAPLFPTMLVIY